MTDLQHVAADQAYEQAAAAWLRANVGARVTVTDPDTGKPRPGTVQEIHAGSGAVRVAIDQKTMHDWFSLEALTPADRLPLGAPVVFPNGVYGVVVGWSTVSCERYEIAWFDRRFWRVNRRCFDRAQFELYTGSAADADHSPAPAA